MTAPTRVAPTPIHEGRDFYAPTFQVEIGNRKLERDVILDVTQVMYKDNLEQVDNFQLTVNNWDARTRAFKYSDTQIFDPGQQVKLWMGYFGKNPLLMITGEINSLRPSFPAAGQPTLVVGGLSRVHQLRQKQQTHPYENRTDSQIAREVAGRLGLNIRTSAEAEGREKPYQYILQRNQYDLTFLRERAAHAGYDMLLEDDPGSPGNQRLYFGPSEGQKRVAYELKYGLSLTEFQPNLTTAQQVRSVRVQGWDAVRKRPITATVTRGQLDTRSAGGADGQSGLDSAFSQREEVITDRPVNSEDEARSLAWDRMNRIAKDTITGTGSVVGLPDLRAGSVMFLTGLGKRFSGRYFVTGTTHTIGDSGYVTQFECRREEL